MKTICPICKTERIDGVDGGTIENECLFCIMFGDVLKVGSTGSVSTQPQGED